MRALFTAATGMEAQQLRIDAIANNLANVSTTAFKRSRAEFQDLFYETLRAPGATNAQGNVLPTGLQVGHGVQAASVTRVFTMGDRLNTGNELDVAIEGDGFFQIERAGGETQYTRDGSFKLDAEGNLITTRGDRVLPGIQIPVDALAVTILPDGTLTAIQQGTTAVLNLGQLDLARFVNPAGLRAVGSNLFAPSDASGDPELGIPGEDGFGELSQGFLENSNVNVAEELVQMILAQRAFETNSRVIRAGDEMLRAAASIAS